MNNRILPLLALTSLAAPASAQTFTSMSAFLAQAGVPTYTETFEIVPISKDTRVTTFTKAGIKYTGLAGIPGPNVVVASPGYTNFAAGPNPTTTSILTASGDEDILVQFLDPTYAVGFDTYYNGLGPATASFFDGATLLASISYNSVAFVGFNGYVATAGEQITSMRWTGTLGSPKNTGIDNLMISSQDLTTTTPEPATLPLLVAGLAGFAMFRRRARVKNG